MNQPFACPVCNGAGTVSRPPGVAGDQPTWMSAGTSIYPCRACDGSGVLWSREPSTYETHRIGWPTPDYTLGPTSPPVDFDFEKWLESWNRPVNNTTVTNYHFPTEVVSGIDMVREFHETFDAPIAEELQVDGVDQRMANLRIEMIREELEELITAVCGFPVKVDVSDYESGIDWRDIEHETDIVEVADALADLAYFIYGTALVYGIDFNAVFAEVHRSNMAKVHPDGSVVRREDGKVLKPEGWEPPDVKGVLGLGGD